MYIYIVYTLTGGNPKGGGARTTGNYAATAFAIAYSKAEASGGGAYFKGAGIIEYSLFQGNYAEATGRTAEGGTATANFSTKTNAHAEARAYGGGAYFTGDGSSITGSLFQGNYAKAMGGWAKGGFSEITVDSIYYETDASGIAKAYAYGGGTYFTGANSHIENSLFLENHAYAKSGWAEANATETIKSTSWPTGHDNAGAYGGGAYFNNTGTIENSRFEGNHAEAEGGTATGGIMPNGTTIYVWFRPILFRSVAGLYSRRKV